MPRRFTLRLAFALGMMTLGVTSSTPALAVEITFVGVAEESALHEAIAVELGSRLDAPDAQLLVELGERSLAVTVKRPGAPPLERVVDRPEDHELPATVAWLAENLLRDQTSDLIAGLTPRAPPPPLLIHPLLLAMASAETAPRIHRSLLVEPSGLLLLPPLISDDAPPFFPLQLALASPAALRPRGEAETFGVDLSLFYSHAGGLRGAGLGAGVRHVDRDATGFELSALWGHRRGDLTGVAFAGLGATGGGDLDGLQAAGLAQWAGNLDGVGLSGPFGRYGAVRGFHAAGLVDVAADVTGVQLQGIAGVGRDVTGLQLSGFSSTARHLKGLQLGVVNVAEEVEGLQVGIVNVARRNRGGAVGLVNIAEDGRIQALAAGGTTGVAQLGVQFVAGYAVSQLTAVYHPVDGHALGGRVAIGPHFAFDGPFLDVLLSYAYHRVVQGGGRGPDALEDRQLVGLGGTFGWRLTRGFGIFGGAGAALEHLNRRRTEALRIVPDLSLGLLLF
ncbi:MAG: hypothetical protein KC731_25775 [Myxococcales bacterium]|nr:hypothetical protein [Myxococcales bacterium]